MSKKYSRSIATRKTQPDQANPLTGICFLLLLIIFFRMGDGETVGNSAYVMNPSQDYVISILESVDGVMGIEAATAATDVNNLLNDKAGGTAAIFFEFAGVDQRQFREGQSVIDKGTASGGCVEVFRNKISMRFRTFKLWIVPFWAGDYKIVGTTIVRTSAKLSKAEQSKLATEICVRLLDNNASDYVEIPESTGGIKFNWPFRIVAVIFVVLLLVDHWKSKKKRRGKISRPVDDLVLKEIFFHRERNPAQEGRAVETKENIEDHNGKRRVPITPASQMEDMKEKARKDKAYKELLDQSVIDYQNWMREMRGLTPLEDELRKIDGMDGYAFESWCAELLKHNGYYNVEVTRSSGDQGVDVIAENGGLKYAIQCKRYSSDLGNKPIQEVVAGKAYYHCHVAAVMTNRYFTAAAKELANVNGVLLWDRDTITDMLKREIPS